MKNIITTTVSFLALLLSASLLSAQSQSPSVIEPFALDITHQKTTNLVFAHSIVSVDKGSKSILAQKAKGADNILQVKAGNENFEETNLTVITSDGKLHSYLVNYSPYPRELNLVFNSSKENPSSVSAPRQNQAVVEANAASIAAHKRTIKNKKDSDFGISFNIEGLYVSGDLLYYQVKLKNETHVGYDIGQLRFFIRDKKRSKRTANQEQELIPQYVFGNTNRIEAGSESMLVFALPKHTIPDKKKLIVQLMEKNGGRHLQLKVSNRTIIKALPL